MRCQPVLILCTLLLWCPVFVAWSAPQQTPHVVLFVLDGTGRDVLDQAVARGELPTIKQLFYDNGTRFTDATTNFPSATSPNYPAMIAGLYPGHLGAPYLAWFDRHAGIYRDFLGLSGRSELQSSVHNWYAEHQPPSALRVRTLFDLLAPLRTAAIYVPYTAGATTSAPKYGVEAAWDVFIRKHPEGLHRAAFRGLRRAFSAPHGQLPHFTMVGLFSPDLLGHKYGSDSPRVRNALHEIDHHLGVFLRQLRARGIDKQTYLIITADHGMHNIRDIIPLAEQLGTLGLRVSTGAPRTDDHIVLAARGIASATLTLRAPGKSWQAPFDAGTLTQVPSANGHPVNLLAWLRAQPTLDSVLVREAPLDAHTNVTSLYRGAMHATVQSRYTRGHMYYSYRPITGDPLGLRKFPSTAAWCNGQARTAAQWNHALANTPFPASVPQLAQIFDDGRAGDVVLVATHDLGFYHHKAATHGSYSATDMRVPLLLHGPGIPQATRGAAQIVDLAPTIAQWFGLQFPVQIDGISLNPSPL